MVIKVCLPFRANCCRSNKRLIYAISQSSVSFNLRLLIAENFPYSSKRTKNRIKERILLLLAPCCSCSESSTTAASAGQLQDAATCG